MIIAVSKQLLCSI